MTTVIGAGQRYDRIIGVGGITVSTDGYLWSDQSQITQPFPQRMRAQGITVNGDNDVWVARRIDIARHWKKTHPENN